MEGGRGGFKAGKDRTGQEGEKWGGRIARIEN